MILVATTAPNGTSTLYSASIDGSGTPMVRAAATITSGTLCNKSGSAATVTLTVTKRGGSSARIMSAYSLAAGDTISLDGYLTNLTFGSGDALDITVSAGSAIDVVISATGTS